MKCVNCGNENNPEAKFCGHCGRALLVSPEIHKISQVDDGKTQSITSIILISIGIFLQIRMFSSDGVADLMAVWGTEGWSLIIPFVAILILLIIGMSLGFSGERKSVEVYGGRTTLAAIGYVLANIAGIWISVVLLFVVGLVIVALFLARQVTFLSNIVPKM